MNNPQGLQYVNQVIRPRAELIRKLKAVIDSDLQTWSAISAQFPQTAESVEDGRDNEGVSRLTCQDIHNFITILTNLKNRLDQAGVAAWLEKPCVRPLEIT